MRASPRAPAAIGPTDEEMADRIRLTALALFEENGYDGTRADQIASDCGISRRSFFRYFPVKGDVLFMDHMANITAVQARLATGRGDPILAAGHALDPLFDSALVDIGFLRRRKQLIGSTPALRDREVLWYREYQDVVASYLVRHDSGSRGAIFAQIVAAAVVAAFGQVIDRWLADPEQENPRALFAEILDDIADSMGADSRGVSPAEARTERTDVVVINSRLSAGEIAHLIEGAER